MFSAGFVVGLALLFTLVKMPWAWKLRILSHPVKVDVIVFVALTAVHWGTFSGVMAATIGALMCSIVLSAGRWAIGYIDQQGSLKPGLFDITSKL